METSRDPFPQPDSQQIFGDSIKELHHKRDDDAGMLAGILGERKRKARQDGILIHVLA